MKTVLVWCRMLRMEKGSSPKETPVRRRFPFEIDRRFAGSVETQFTDALRAAIVSGRYKPGDVLPSIVEFSRGLGVSIRAPQAALKALAREGLVCPRRRTGTIVAGPRDAAFRGNVLLVNANRHPVYYDSFIEARAADALAAAGYIATHVVTPLRHKGARGDPESETYDIRQLRLALRQSTSFALVFGSRRQIVSTVAKTSVPFAVVGGGSPPDAPGCVAFASSGLESVLPDIVARLGRIRPRRLLQVAIRGAELLDGNALAPACGVVENLVLWPETRGEPLGEDFVRAGFDAVRQRLAHAGEAPDAYLFTDDYPARGALTALLAAGVRTGRDVFLMTLAHKGLAPVHPDPVDLLLHDPAQDAESVAAAALDFLETGKRPGAFPLPVRLVRDFVGKPAATGA